MSKIEYTVVASSTDKILKERGKRYGEFRHHAEISQELKNVMKSTPGWHDLTHAQKECLEMIAHKVARILNGDPNYLDSWIDCIDYLQLVVNMLEEKTDATHP